MKFIDSVEQCQGPGGMLERWSINNGLILSYWKDEKYYFIVLEDNTDKLYTKGIYNLLNHPYNDIEISFVSFMPKKIKMEHKYFNKFIQLVEKLSIDNLQPDPFSG